MDNVKRLIDVQAQALATDIEVIDDQTVQATITVPETKEIHAYDKTLLQNTAVDLQNQIDDLQAQLDKVNELLSNFPLDKVPGGIANPAEQLGG
jgi:lantibiotic modifying enzyme